MATALVGGGLGGGRPQGRLVPELSGAAFDRAFHDLAPDTGCNPRLMPVRTGPGRLTRATRVSQEVGAVPLKPLSLEAASTRTKSIQRHSGKIIPERGPLP